MKKLFALFVLITAGYVAPALAVPNDVIDRAQTAFTEQLSLDCTSNAPRDWVAKDAVYQYVLSDIYLRLSVEGRDAVAEHLCALSDGKSGGNVIQDIHYYPTLDPEVVFVQYEMVPVDGFGKRANQLAIIRMRNNQIARFTQLNRSPESLKVLTAGMKREN
ncbi:MAG: hypothetical protein PVH25_09305 [Burkholderiales bacterium]